MLHSDMMAFQRALERAGCGIVTAEPCQKRPVRPNYDPSPYSRSVKSGRARDAILKASQEHGVSVDEILGRSRSYKIVDARYAAIRAVADAVELSRSCGNWAGGFWSTKAIAHLFGRDHTTICYALGRLTGKPSRRAPAQ